MTFINRGLGAPVSHKRYVASSDNVKAPIINCMDKNHIRPIAICLFRKGNQILVSEGYDSSNQYDFCRPLGGEIEFGEHSRDALLREIREEIGAEVENVELRYVLENIFHYEGQQGHEVVFVYDAELSDKSLYERKEIHGYREEIDAKFIARWRSVAEIEKNKMKLVPEGLSDLLRE